MAAASIIRWILRFTVRDDSPSSVAIAAQRVCNSLLGRSPEQGIAGALRRDWSESLACVYGELGPAEVNARLRQGEAWLVAQPNSAALLLTLGRLCNQAELWGKARDYLARALAIAPDATIWEAYGNACAAQGDAASAQSAYRNALRCARGEPAETLPELERSALDTRASVVEERSEHGVPRLIVPGR